MDDVMTSNEMGARRGADGAGSGRPRISTAASHPSNARRRPDGAGSDPDTTTLDPLGRGVARVGHLLVSSLFGTVRIRRSGTEHYLGHRNSGQSVIFVFRHQHLLPLIHVHRSEGIVVLVSQHRDGELVNRVMAKRGFGSVRGSSTRGGSNGLRSLIRSLNSGRDVAVTPDGPRGPSGTFKPGAFLAAKLSGAPVVPIAVGATPSWAPATWDNLLVPLPFAEVRIEYLPSRRVPPEANRGFLTGIAEELSSEVSDACARLAGPSRRDMR